MATITHTVNRDARVTATMGAGACAHLDVGVYGGYTYESWLAFTGESWAGIPNAAAITSAVLYVYASGEYHIARSAGTMRVQRTLNLGTIFTEGTSSHPLETSNAVRGDNAPTRTSTNEATASISDSNGWKTVTITNIIKDYFGQSNYALQLHANSGVYEFAAREAGSSDAYIVITYNANSVPNPPTLNSPIDSVEVSTQTPTLNFTPSDPDGDVHTEYTFATWVAGSFSNTETGVIAGSFTNGVAVNRVLTVAHNRGSTYHWWVKTRDATNGYGAFSALGTFRIATVPTVSVTHPASATVAPLWYTGGSNTTPKLYTQWAFSDPDNHAQTQCIIRIYADSAGSKSTLLDTRTVNQAANYDYNPYVVTNLSYYWISYQVTCAAGAQSTETTAVRFRVCWGRASYYYNIGATAPTGWGSPIATVTGYSVVTEWASSTTTAEPGTWYASLAQVPLPNGAANYVWHRVTMVGWDGTGTPTKPTVMDVTPVWTTSTLTPDHWNLVGNAHIDTSDRKYGTQSVKCDAVTGQWHYAYQTVKVQAGYDYVYSAYIKTVGSPGAFLEVKDGAGNNWQAYGPVNGTAEFTRYQVGPFNTGSNTQVTVTAVSYGTTGGQVWFDALKLEQSSVVTPWAPGSIGTGGVVIDSGGVEVDASNASGAVFRLTGSTGGTRDVVSLGGHALVFGGDVPVYSSSASNLDVGDDGVGAASVRIAGGPSGDEGGELYLFGSGNYRNWWIDNYQGYVRVADSIGGVRFAVTSGEVRSTVPIVSESYLQATAGALFLNDAATYGIYLGYTNSAWNTRVWAPEEKHIATDAHLSADAMAPVVTRSSSASSLGSTWTAATWYKIPYLSLQITPKFTGQKFEIGMRITFQDNSSATGVVNLHSATVHTNTSGTVLNYVDLVQQQNIGVANAYYTVSSTGFWTAPNTNTHYIYAMAQSGTSGHTLTYYMDVNYGSVIYARPIL